jgi:dTDP-4-dehydrorhamnose 3,5-epimerase
MLVSDLEITDVKLIVPNRFEDQRGFFSEIYNARLLADAGITDTFVQDNLSLSIEVGTIRGLHFQRSGSFFISGNLKFGYLLERLI